MIAKMNSRIATVLLFLSATAMAGDAGWTGRDGSPIQPSNDQRSIGGFGGWLVVTPDADWEAKWNTPPEVVPHFTTASKVRVGEVLTILIFFGNPELDPAGHVRIECDLSVTRPDGTRSIDEHNATCARGPISGDPMSIRLAEPFLKYIGEPQDQIGVWSVQVTLHDRNREVSVPLSTSFELVR